MEPQEFEKIIRNVLVSIKKAESPATLLVFSGGSRYLLGRFYLEAQKVCANVPVDIAVDPYAQPFLEEDKIRKLRCGNVYGYGGDSDVEKMLCGKETVITGSMDIGAASKVANLITDSLPSKIVSAALLKGIKVVSNDFLQEINGPETGAYVLAIKKMAETVSSYGVTLIRLEELGKYLCGPQPSAGSEKPVEDLVTEGFIRAFQGEKLKLAKGAVVTPLARDLARERKIHFSRG